MLSKNQIVLLAALLFLICFNIALFGIYTYYKSSPHFNKQLTTIPVIPPDEISINNQLVTKDGDPFKGPALSGQNKNKALYIFNAIIMEIVKGRDKETLVLYARKTTGELIQDPLPVQTSVKPILYMGAGKDVPHKEVNITELKKGDQVQIKYNIDLLSHTGEIVGMEIYRP